MSFVLSDNSYGKSRVRLSQITRHPDRHEIREVSVDIRLRGGFADSYLTGGNATVIPTDTMKNTVYGLAAGYPITSVEDFGLRLGRHFVDGFGHVESAVVHLAETPWTRIAVGGKPHPTAFVAGSAEKHTAIVEVTRGGAVVRGGVEELLVLKTTDSEFVGFVRDRFTTLPDVRDRILATMVTAEWLFSGDAADWNAARASVRTALLECFAGHKSLAVQQTLFDMGKAALEACPAVAEITLTMPNKHRIPMDLRPFGMENKNEIFVTTDEPHGLISGTIRRG